MNSHPKFRALLACIVIVGLFAGAHAFGEAPIVQIDDGRPQGPSSYQIALDELYVQGAGFEKIPGQETLESLSSLVVDSITNTAKTAYLVLYPVGAQHVDVNRRILTDKIVIDADAAGVSAAKATPGVFSVEPVGDFAPSSYEVTVTSPTKTIETSKALASLPGIRSVHPQISRRLQLKATPNDPLFNSQWHLKNGLAGGVDLDITSVWDTNKGDGIVIGIVDTGVDTHHQDLSPALVPSLNHDFLTGGSNPDPHISDDEFGHGTSCAGLAGGRGFNAIGICGVAPRALLAGLRLIGGMGATDAQEAQAISWQNGSIFIKSNSWGPFDDLDFYAGPGPLALAALQASTSGGRGGKGTSFVWAAGNGGIFDNSNFDGYANSIYAIAVGAVNEFGKKISYSEPGANILVAAPSGGDSPARQIVTTDAGLTGVSLNSYTASFNGTSAACPQVAGIVALMLKANSALSWRDIQNILIRTAVKNDAGDADWATNSAGLHFNHFYGAGLVDAAAAVAAATTIGKLPAQLTYSKSVASGTLPLAIPLAPASATFTIPVSTGIHSLEHAVLVFSSSIPTRGNLQVTLTSPTGMVSILATPFVDYFNVSDVQNWPFSTVRGWGEDPNGLWTVTVSDSQLIPSNTGMVTAATLKLYGTATGSGGGGGGTGNGPVTVTSHVDGVRSSSFINLGGTVALPAGTVREVEYRVTQFGAISQNTQPEYKWTKVSGQSPWTAAIKLKKGYNIIILRAISTDGTISAPTSFHVLVK